MTNRVGLLCFIVIARVAMAQDFFCAHELRLITAKHAEEHQRFSSRGFGAAPVDNVALYWYPKTREIGFTTAKLEVGPVVYSWAGGGGGWKPEFSTYKGRKQPWWYKKSGF